MPVPAEHAADNDYRESTDFEWTEKAFALLTDGELVGTVISGGGVVRSQLRGQCPKCGHQLDDRQTHTAVTNVFGGEQRGPVRATAEPAVADLGLTYYQVDVTCDCAHAHGAPQGRTGCGTSFRVELELQPEGGADRL